MVAVRRSRPCREHRLGRSLLVGLAVPVLSLLGAAALRPHLNPHATTLPVLALARQGTTPVLAGVDGKAPGGTAPLPAPPLAAAPVRHHRTMRAGVFQMPVLSPVDLAVGPLAVVATPASLEVDTGAEARPILKDSSGPIASLPAVPGVDDALIPPEFDGELPSDPVRDGLKAGQPTTWPTADQTRKGDLTPGTPHGAGPTAWPQSDPWFRGPGSRPLHIEVDALGPWPLSRHPGPFTPGPTDAAVPMERVVAFLPVPAAPVPSPAPLPGPQVASLPPAAAPPTAPKITVATVRLGPARDETFGTYVPPAWTPPGLGRGEGVTTATKSVVGLDDGTPHPLTLPPVLYARSQACLATAIYFEARSESRLGQVAVAQVILNRVRSPYYPKNVCDVVYQGAHGQRYGGCQFSFACDGIKDTVKEPDSWAGAMAIAARVMDGQDYLPDVGNATHYHAVYVRPRWLRDMVRKDQVGRHIFYRVRWWA